jgi:hypothetical protein
MDENTRFNKVVNLTPKIHYNSPVSIYNVEKISGGKPPDPYSKRNGGREGKRKRGEGASP